MERKVTKLENSHVEVLVTVDTESWKAAQDKAFKKLAANVTVPGFRKGKAPEHLLKGKVDPAKTIDNAINDILPTVYGDVLTNEKIRPMSQPKIDVTKLTQEELEIKFVIVVAPEITLGEYKNLKIGKQEASVTEEDVTKAIEDLQKQNATLVVKEAEAAMGDTVTIDFVGSVDDVEFEGGKGENYDLELGSNSFIPGFEDQCVGLKAGDKKDIFVKFPENYTENLKGKDAKFAITCHEVKGKSIPAIDEEFIKELKLPNVETLDQLKEAKQKELLKQKEENLRREYLASLLKEICAKATVSVPDEILDNQVAQRRKQTEERMAQSGLTLEQYLSILGQKEEDFMAQLKEAARVDYVNYLALNKVAELEKIEVSDAEVELEMAKIADQYKMKIEDVKKALEPQMDEYRYNLLMTNIENFLYINND